MGFVWRVTRGRGDRLFDWSWRGEALLLLEGLGFWLGDGLEGYGLMLVWAYFGVEFIQGSV